LQRPILISSEIYRRAAFGTNHPLAIPRVATVMDLCAILGWCPNGAYHESARATPEQLARFHDPAYIEAVRSVSASGIASHEVREHYNLGNFENPIFPGLYERAATSVGGSIDAARLVAQGGVAFHPAGGTHHGRPDRASGFCYFNDPVFALLELRDQGLNSLYYLDLDAHHGDAVQDAFASDDAVFTVSIHEADRWPYSGGAEDRARGGARNLPVPSGFNDTELEYLMQTAVLPIGARLKPDAVVVTCGADGLAGDPLSGMALSNVALWCAVEQAIALAPRAVILGGGGYNPWTVARCWTGLWGRLNGYDVTRTLPPQAQSLLRGLRSDLVDDDEVAETWLTTLADEPAPGPLRDAVRAVADASLRA